MNQVGWFHEIDDSLLQWPTDYHSPELSSFALCLGVKPAEKIPKQREKSLFGDLLWVLERVFRTYINESSFHTGNALEAFHK